MVFAGLGRGCPMCWNELDQEAVQLFFASPERREEDRQIYGIDRAALAGTGPSVVMLNGIIASLAAMEFVAFITGVRQPMPHLTYRGEMGTVHIPRERPKANCYYCVGIFQGQEEVDLEKYLGGTNK